MIREFSTATKQIDKTKLFIDFIVNYYKTKHTEGKRTYFELYPNIKLIQEKLLLSQEDVNKIFLELKNHGKTGNNIFNYYAAIKNKYKNNAKQETKNTIKQKTIIKKKPKKIKIKQRQESNNRYNKLVFIIFKAIIFVVGLCFIYIGIKYNYYGNLKNKDQLDALICSFCFMLMAIICFEMFIFYWMKKKPSAWLFVFLYLILFSYNTGTILYYQYDKYQEKNYFSQENIQTKKDMNNIEKLNKTITDLETIQKNKQEERTRQFKILNSIDQTDNRYYQIYWSINSKSKDNPGLDKQIADISNEIKTARNQISELEKNSNIFSNEKKELFSGLLLMIYLFLPSFTIEFLASICLALLLFIKFD